MRRCLTPFIVFALIISSLLSVDAALQTQKQFEDVTLSLPEGGGVSSFHFPDVYNLMLSDCVISYDIDMSKVKQTESGKTPFISVGMREVIESPDEWDNFIPGNVGVQPGGKGGWMLSLVGDLSNSGNTFDFNEKHQLQTSGFIEENAYNAELIDGELSISSTPIGSAPPYNFGIWFDHYYPGYLTASSWGYIQGVNYSTNGKYSIKIHYHATSASEGVMFASINGMPQGFYPFSDRAPLHYPAGISFSGDMSQMQVFAGILGDPLDTSGDVEISNFSISVYGKGEAMAPTVPDITPPSIFLRGSSSITVEQDSENNQTLDLSAFAIDDQDGVVKVEDDLDSVNFSKSGLYTVKYSATDSAGNTATAQRTINVKKNPKLEGAITSGYYPYMEFDSPDGGGIVDQSYPDVFDLTQHDLRLAYRIELKKVQQTAPWRSVLVEVGLRNFTTEATPLDNFNPGQLESHPGGQGGWMISLVGDLEDNSQIVNFNDKHNLQTSGNIDELAYNVLSTEQGFEITEPLGIGIPFSYGIWFDRSNVDKTSRKFWGAYPSRTYNTNGAYDIEIFYRATSDSQGVMFARVNGVPQGFFPTYDGPPLLMPVGLDFQADMKNLQLFVGMLSDPDYASGQVKVYNVNIELHSKGSLSAPGFWNEK